MKFIKLQIFLFIKLFVDAWFRIVKGRQTERVVHSIALKPGLKLWGLNLNNAIVVEVTTYPAEELKTEGTIVRIRDKKATDRAYVYHNDWLYVQALRKEKAIKKLKQTFKNMYLDEVRKGNVPRNDLELQQTLKQIEQNSQ